MSESNVKRIIDVDYNGYQSLPRWSKIVKDTVRAHIEEIDPSQSDKRILIKISQVAQMPDSKFRIEITPPQHIDSEELTGTIIDNLRELELLSVLEKRREELDIEFCKRRINWEDSEIERRKAWENKIQDLQKQHLEKYDTDIANRRVYEVEESVARRKFELEQVNDNVSRTNWENRHESTMRQLQKKVTAALFLSIIATVFGLISFLN